MFEIFNQTNEKINEIKDIENVIKIAIALEDDTSFPTTDYRILGDIYISIDRAYSQALEYGHSFKREICFLSVHGFLHLLGFDHMNEEDEKEMFSLQEEILNEAKITR